jgi:hypothetical protein
MPRIRTVKPEFWNDEKLGQEPESIMLTYIGIWNFSDDYGVVKANHLWLKNQIYPYKSNLRIDVFSTWLNRLVELEALIPFTYRGESFFCIRTFRKHQKVDHPSKARNCPEDELIRTMSEKEFAIGEEGFIKHSDKTRRVLIEPSCLEVVSSNGSSKSNGIGAPAVPPEFDSIVRKNGIRTKRMFAAPSQTEVQNFFIEKVGEKWGEGKAKTVADECLDHYTANGWVQGKGKAIIDWRAACRNWMRREIKGAFSNQPRSQSQVQSTPAALPVNGQPVVDKTLLELNYLYDLFQEEKCTTISIETTHYDYLKKSGRISFSELEVSEIRQEAVDQLNQKLLPTTEQAVIQNMKKIGVIKFFSRMKEANASQIV